MKYKTSTYNSFILKLKGIPLQFFSGLLFAMLTMVCAGCTDDLSIRDNINEDDLDTSERIIIKASLNATNKTRTYYGQEDIESLASGTFWLRYPYTGQTVNSYSYAKYDAAVVNFGHEEDPTTGYVAYTNKNGVLKDLKWSKVYGGGNTSIYFYMMNVDPSAYYVASEGYYPNTYSYQKYVFYDNATQKNPFFASPLDKKNGSNDLIMSGGTTMTNSSSPSFKAGQDIHLNLYHRMALMRLNIEVYSAKDGHKISLDNASVKITNLFRTLGSINIQYAASQSYYKDQAYIDKNVTSSFSKVYYNGLKNYASEDDDQWICLVGNNAYSWEPYKDEETGEEVNFKEEPVPLNGNENSDETYTKRTYTVRDFVLPPQTFDVEGHWPKLKITVPKYDVTGFDEDKNSSDSITYIGSLPNRMYDADEPLVTKTTLLNTGYILNLSATIDSPNSELTFNPAMVENWISKGSFTITTKKSGIYTSGDFQSLIETYGLALETGDFEDLEKFGYKTTGGDGKDLYVFTIWSNFTINPDEVNLLGSMAYDERLKFLFLFNDFTVTLDNGEAGFEIERLNGLEGQNELYRKVTGQTLGFYKGITSSQKMIELINLCHSNPENGYSAPDYAKLFEFGNLSNFDNIWTFGLESDITLDFEDIYQKIDNDFLINSFYLNLNGHSIDINFGNATLKCEENGGIDYFSRLAVINPTTGVTSPEDFLLLKYLYNNGIYENYPQVFELFGTHTVSNTSDIWNFYFHNGMTLKGEDAFGCMTPDEDNNKPNYNFYTYPVGTTSSTTFSPITFDHPLIPFEVKTRVSIANVFKRSGYYSTNQNIFSNSTSALNYYYNNNDYRLLFSYGYFEDGKWHIGINYTSNSSNYSYAEYDYAFGCMVPEPDQGKYDYEFTILRRVDIRNMPNTPLEGAPKTTRYFYPDDSQSATYPNNAEGLKKITDGTFWDDWTENGN